MRCKSVMNNCIRKWGVRSWEIPVCGILLSLLFLLHITSLRHKGLTTDETVHYEYGEHVLHGAPQRTRTIDSSKMPFSSPNAMTSESLATLARLAGISVDMSETGQVKRGRYATIALSLLLALYVFKWSYELYGRNGALISLSLYIFDPNLLAHGQLVTTDLPAALMTTVALYHFWHFLNLGGIGRSLLSAATLALSQLAKYTCIYLYPIFLLITAIYRPSPTAAEALRPSWWQWMMGGIGRWAIVITFFAVINVLIINLGFEFNGVGTPLSGYALKDPFFKKLQATPLVGSLPLPLPVPYVQGLDLCKFQEMMGQTWGNLYMAGKLRVNRHDGTLHGFPGYYFYTGFFKVPIATQVIFLLALLGFFLQRGQAATALRREEVSYVVPMLVYWVNFNFFFNAQIGIRHILPIVALATIFCGRFLATPRSGVRHYTGMILVAWVAVSMLCIIRISSRILMNLYG